MGGGFYMLRGIRKVPGAWDYSSGHNPDSVCEGHLLGLGSVAHQVAAHITPLP